MAAKVLGVVSMEHGGGLIRFCYASARVLGVVCNCVVMQLLRYLGWLLGLLLGSSHGTRGGAKVLLGSC